MRKLILPALSAMLWGLTACEEQTPTGASENFLPVAPATIEVLLPWSDFASGFSVFGGFGVPADRGVGVLANRYQGTLDARTLGRWPFQAMDELVNDTTGTLVHDTQLRPSDARIVLFLDTLASTRVPVTISAHRTLVDWDERTATWTHAVDSAGDRRPWPVPGGGPAQRVGQALWDPSAGVDSLVLPVDTAVIRIWADSVVANRGFRLDADTEGTRVEVRNLQLRYNLIPSVRPDTTLVRAVDISEITFIYTPEPGPTSGELRVGGIPGWRSVIHTDLPTVLNGPAELCATLGCPFELTTEKINHASLVLTTRPTDPPGFAPLDSVRLDVRAVLSPDRLPKSPLGPSLVNIQGRVLAPSAFASPTAVTVPVTSFVLALFTEREEGSLPPPRSLALLSLLEPNSIAFVNFAGPGQPGEPRLRLILTASPTVELP